MNSANETTSEISLEQIEVDEFDASEPLLYEQYQAYGVPYSHQEIAQDL